MHKNSKSRLRAFRARYRHFNVYVVSTYLFFEIIKKPVKSRGVDARG